MESSDASLSDLQRQCVTLMKAKQWKSCEIVAQMQLSKCGNDRFASIPLEILGDCAQNTQQNRRAISFFRRAAMFSADDSRLRWKEAQCLSMLGNILEAVSVLERVSNRNLGMAMTLGHLYAASGRQLEATQLFLESLKMNAYALEAVEWLAILGADRNDVISAAEQGLAGKEENPLPVIELVSAHFLIHHKQTAVALTSFIKLEQRFPNNVHFLLKIALLQVRPAIEPSNLPTYLTPFCHSFK